MKIRLIIVLPLLFLVCGLSFAKGIMEERQATEAVRYLEAEKQYSTDVITYYNLSCIYSVKNDLENAIRAMNKAFVFGYIDLEYISRDEDLINLRTTAWWQDIEKNKPQLIQILNEFSEFIKIEEEKSNEERIYFYSNLISSLNEFAPGVPALQRIPLTYLTDTYKNAEDTQNEIDCYIKRTDIELLVLGDNPILIESLNNLGFLYDKIEDYENAKKSFHRSLNIIENIFGRECQEYAETLCYLGLMHFRTENYMDAEKYLHESLDIMGRTIGKDNLHYAATAYTIGNMYNSAEDFTKAAEFYYEALIVLESISGKENQNYLNTLSILGSMYNILGNYIKAEEIFLEALSISEKVFGKEHIYYIRMLNRINVAYIYMGLYTQAEQFCLEAYNLSEQVLGKEHPYYNSALNNLGLLYIYTKDYAKAEEYLIESLNLREKIYGRESKDYALSVMNLGGLYYYMKDYQKAEPYYLEALDLRKRLLGTDHPFYAEPLHNLGALYDDMGDYEKAEKYYLEALSLRERTLGTGHSLYIRSVELLSYTYMSAGNYTKALEKRQEAVHLGINKINSNFAFLSERQREEFWDDNNENFIVSYSLSWHYPVPESSILSYDTALFAKGILLRTTNAIRDSIYNSGDQNLITQYEELNALKQRLNVLHQSGNNDSNNEAYIKELEQRAETLERSLNQMSSAFRDFNEDLNINWQSIRDSLQGDEAAVEFISFHLYDKNWTGKIIYAALVLRHDMEAPLWILLCEDSELNNIYTKLDEIFETYPRWQRQREKDKTRVEILYDELGTELYNAVWQPLEKALDGITSVYYSPSGQLHKISFNSLPAGIMLKEADDDDEYDEYYEPEIIYTRLADKYDLNLVSSTREVVYRDKQTQKPESAVIYGGLVYDLDEEIMRQEALVYLNSNLRIASRGIVPDLSNSQGASGGTSWSFLEGTVSESEKVRELLGANGVSVTLYSESRGNKESFFNLDGNKMNILHLATHGFFVEDAQKDREQRERFERLGGQKAFENPLLRSGLILSGGNNAWRGIPVEGAENGILLAADVAGLNLLGAQLVVLSACESALGGINNQEGVFGLQRAFKLAGAETIIMSLWEVSDEATDILISGFYENWLSGMSRQEAFKKAQQELRKNPDFAEPYFWAAFVMMD